MQKQNYIMFFPCFPALNAPNLVNLFKDSNERWKKTLNKKIPKLEIFVIKCLFRDAWFRYCLEMSFKHQCLKSGPHSHIGGDLFAP